MKLLTLLFFAASLAAQTITLTGPANAYPGSTINLSLTLAGSQGTNIAGLEWGISGAGITFAAPSAGAASTAATKTLWCNATNTLCIAIGLSNGTPQVISALNYSDGVVATIPVTIPSAITTSSMTIALSGLLGATSAGVSVPITSGPAYSIVILSKCDVNRDGKVDASDVVAVLNPIVGNGSCTLSQGCTLQTLIAVLTAANGGSCTLQ